MFLNQVPTLTLNAVESDETLEPQSPDLMSQHQGPDAECMHRTPADTNPTPYTLSVEYPKPQVKYGSALGTFVALKAIFPVSMVLFAYVSLGLWVLVLRL